MDFQGGGGTGAGGERVAAPTNGGGLGAESKSCGGFEASCSGGGASRGGSTEAEAESELNAGANQVAKESTDTSAG